MLVLKRFIFIFWGGWGGGGVLGYQKRAKESRQDFALVGLII